MKKYKILIFVILIFTIWICMYLQTSSIMEPLVNHVKIPNKIWSFWHSDELPTLVEKCIQSWKIQNPNYEITILNKKNLTEYLPDVDFTKIKHITESVQKYSDMVRLHILSKYGGIWSDATIICLKPYDDWIPKLQEEKNCDFIGFYIEKYTLPEYKEYSPIIENWFFACVENAILIKDWLIEFSRISDYDTISEYIDSLKTEGVDLQKLDDPGYLTMHASLQKVLQKGPNKPYTFGLLKAEDNAYKYLTQNEWDSNKAIQNILDCNNKNIDISKCDFYNSPIIKLRGMERAELEKNNINIFL